MAAAWMCLLILVCSAHLDRMQLDYAARDKDKLQVQEHYGNIVSALDEIFAKIT